MIMSLKRLQGSKFLTDHGEKMSKPAVLGGNRTLAQDASFQRCCGVVRHQSGESRAVAVSDIFLSSLPFLVHIRMEQSYPTTALLINTKVRAVTNITRIPPRVSQSFHSASFSLLGGALSCTVPLQTVMPIEFEVLLR